MNMTNETKFFTVTWAQRVGKFYERNQQTVKGEKMLHVVIAAVKRLPGVPANTVSYQGGL